MSKDGFYLPPLQIASISQASSCMPGYCTTSSALWTVGSSRHHSGMSQPRGQKPTPTTLSLCMSLSASCWVGVSLPCTQHNLRYRNLHFVQLTAHALSQQCCFGAWVCQPALEQEFPQSTRNAPWSKWGLLPLPWSYKSVQSRLVLQLWGPHLLPDSALLAAVWCCLQLHLCGSSIMKCCRRVLRACLSCKTMQPSKITWGTSWCRPSPSPVRTTLTCLLMRQLQPDRCMPWARISQTFVVVHSDTVLSSAQHAAYFGNMIILLQDTIG